MMNDLRKLVLVLALAAACAPISDGAAAGSPGDIVRIAFGSCAHQDKPQPVWQQILAADPDVMLMLGDNIYGDTEDMSELAAKYQKLGDIDGFETLRKRAQILATWDDHDFGANDAGGDFIPKEESRRLMLDFFNEPADSPRRTRSDGIYGAWIIGPPGRRVQIILPDLRWNRTPLRHVTPEEYKTRCEPMNLGPYLPDESGTGVLLGESQWQWLEQQLREPAEVRLLGMSIQCLAEFTGWEAWANFPHERARLLELLRDTRVGGVVLLSGDTHWAELSRIDASEGAPYPLFEVTSSGLTEVWEQVSPNRHRVGRALAAANFGLVEIDWSRRDPTITLQVIRADGPTFLQQTLVLSDLQPKP